MRIHSALSYRQNHVLKKHTNWINCLAEKQCVLISGSLDKTFYFWDIRANFSMLRKVQSNQYVCSMHASPLRNIFTSGGNDQKLFQFWHLKLKKSLSNYDTHTGKIQHLIYFIGKGDLVLVGAENNVLRLYQLENAPFEIVQLNEWDLKGGISSCALLTEEALLATSLMKGGVYTLSLNPDTGYAEEHNDSLLNDEKLIKVSHIVSMPNFSFTKCPYVFLLSANGISLFDVSKNEVVERCDAEHLDWGGFRGGVFVPRTWQLWTGSRSGGITIYDVV